MDLRTETEVAEAFFSASNGNMDMLNSMLGEQYDTMDEAMAGIQKKQGGLVEEMSGTVGGLMSTIVGKSKDAMKNFVKVFQEPLNNVQNAFIGFIDKASPALVEFGNKVSVFFTEFSKSETAKSLLEYFGTVATVVFNGVKAVIDAVWPIVQKVFNFFIDRLPQIQNIVNALGTIWNAVWSVVGKLLQAAWKIVEPILGALFDVLNDVATMINNVGNWWKDMCDKIKNNPIVAKVTETWDKVTGKGGKSNAFGSSKIARDGELHKLHRGEKVLTANQTRQYEQGSNSGNVTINMNGVTVREESDIKKIAKELVKEINKTKLGYGGAY